MHIQISLFENLLMKKNEKGELVSPTGIIVTKSFLEVCLRYRSNEEVAHDVLGISMYELNELIEGFQIKLDDMIRLSREHIKIMEVTQRYLDKYEEFPPLSYLQKRTKYKHEVLYEGLGFLTKNNFIIFKGHKIRQLLRAV